MEINRLAEAYFEDISAVESIDTQQRILVGFLKEQVGKPYKYGANSAATGDRVFDCSSLVQEAYKKIGINLARTSVNQATYYGRVVEEDEELQIGDLLFFSGEYGYYNPQYPMGIGHVATFIGDGKVIHTKAWFEDGEEFGVVIEESLEELLTRSANMVEKESDLVDVKRIFEGNQYYHEGKAHLIPQNPQNTP